MIGINRLSQVVRALPPGAVLLIASALLALLGAANASLHSLHQMAQFGVIGTNVALGVVWGFCDWSQPPFIGRR